MIPLTAAEAVEHVRKNLDEQGLNDSAMFNEATDNVELDNLVKKTLPEAINSVISNAPVSLLEGEDMLSKISNITVKDKVLSFPLDADLLRLVAFQATDSPIVVTDTIAESSPEGRMQFNKYVRGTWDAPVLVQEHAKAQPYKFNYYTLKEDGGDGRAYIKRCEFILAEREQKEAYSVPSGLLLSIIYRLTGLVCAIYGIKDKSEYFFGLASSEMGI